MVVCLVMMTSNNFWWSSDGRLQSTFIDDCGISPNLETRGGYMGDTAKKISTLGSNINLVGHKKSHADQSKQAQTANNNHVSNIK